MSHSQSENYIFMPFLQINQIHLSIENIWFYQLIGFCNFFILWFCGENFLRIFFMSLFLLHKIIGQTLSNQPIFPFYYYPFFLLIHFYFWSKIYFKNLMYELQIVIRLPVVRFANSPFFPFQSLPQTDHQYNPWQSQNPNTQIDAEHDNLGVRARIKDWEKQPMLSVDQENAPYREAKLENMVGRMIRMQQFIWGSDLGLTKYN